MNAGTKLYTIAFSLLLVRAVQEYVQADVTLITPRPNQVSHASKIRRLTSDDTRTVWFKGNWERAFSHSGFLVWCDYGRHDHPNASTVMLWDPVDHTVSVVAPGAWPQWHHLEDRLYFLGDYDTSRGGGFLKSYSVTSQKTQAISDERWGYIGDPDGFSNTWIYATRWNKDRKEREAYRIHLETGRAQRLPQMDSACQFHCVIGTNYVCTRGKKTVGQQERNPNTYKWFSLSGDFLGTAGQADGPYASDHSFYVGDIFNVTGFHGRRFPRSVEVQEAPEKLIDYSLVGRLGHGGRGHKHLFPAMSAEATKIVDVESGTLKYLLPSEAGAIPGTWNLSMWQADPRIHEPLDGTIRIAWRSNYCPSSPFVHLVNFERDGNEWKLTTTDMGTWFPDTQEIVVHHYKAEVMRVEKTSNSSFRVKERALYGSGRQPFEYREPDGRLRYGGTIVTPLKDRQMSDEDFQRMEAEWNWSGWWKVNVYDKLERPLHRIRRPQLYVAEIPPE
jgi:hypothetical protein